MRTRARSSPFPPSRRYGCLRFELMVGEESNRETTRLEGKGEGGEARASLTLTPWLFIANKFRHAVRGEKELVSD